MASTAALTCQQNCAGGRTEFFFSSSSRNTWVGLWKKKGKKKRQKRSLQSWHCSYGPPLSRHNCQAWEITGATERTNQNTCGFCLFAVHACNYAHGRPYFINAIERPALLWFWWTGMRRTMARKMSRDKRRPSDAPQQRAKLTRAIHFRFPTRCKHKQTRAHAYTRTHTCAHAHKYSKKTLRSHLA